VFWLRLRAHHCHPAPPNHRCAEPPSHRLTPPPLAGYYCICGKLLVLDMPNCIMDICLCDKYAMASMPRPPELPAPLLAMRARGQNQTIIHPVAAAVDDYFRFLRRARESLGIGVPRSAHANTSCWVSFDFCECGPH